MLSAEQNRAIETQNEKNAPEWVKRQWTDTVGEQGVPWCCINCKNLEADYNEWRGLTGYFCAVNVPKLPTRKGTCKKQEPWQIPTEPEEA